MRSLKATYNKCTSKKEFYQLEHKSRANQYDKKLY